MWLLESTTLELPRIIWAVMRFAWFMRGLDYVIKDISWVIAKMRNNKGDG